MCTQLFHQSYPDLKSCVAMAAGTLPESVSPGACTCRAVCAAAAACLCCTLLALAISHTMLLQHHYGQHLFGDDLAQGARVTVRVHRVAHHHPRRRAHAFKRALTASIAEAAQAVTKIEDDARSLDETVAASEGMTHKWHYGLAPGRVHGTSFVDDHFPVNVVSSGPLLACDGAVCNHSQQHSTVIQHIYRQVTCLQALR